MNTAVHDRPEGRPIHPECPAIRRPDVPCECMARWCGWDGTEPDLHDRIAVMGLRESRRRDWCGVAADEDDLHGFWRESERLQAALANIEKVA